MGDEWLEPILPTAPDAGVGFCRVRKSSKGLVGSFGVICKALATDDSKLMVQSVITTPYVDLQGDSVDPDGFDTSYHQQTRTVLLDHGQDYPLPVGLAEEGINKSYTVRRAGERWIADTHFHPNKVGVQLYDLCKSDVMRGWSSAFVPTVPGVPLGPFNKSLRRSPMRFPGVQLQEYSVTANPMNPEALTILAQKGRLHEGAFDEIIMKSLRPYLPEGRSNSVAVPDHPLLVSKAMQDDTGGGEATPTARHSYDGAQGVSDIADHIEQGLTQCEHAKGKKKLKKILDDLRSIVDELKANGDMVGSDLDDKPDEQDKMVDEPEPVTKNADGLIVIQKSKYEPKRWTTKDVAAALGQTNEQPTRKSRSDRETEREADRKRKALERINSKYGKLAAV